MLKRPSSSLVVTLQPAFCAAEITEAYLSVNSDIMVYLCSDFVSVQRPLCSGSSLELNYAESLSRLKTIASTYLAISNAEQYVKCKRSDEPMMSSHEIVSHIEQTVSSSASRDETLGEAV